MDLEANIMNFNQNLILKYFEIEWTVSGISSVMLHFNLNDRWESISLN